MVGCIAEHLTTQIIPKPMKNQELYRLAENFQVVQIFQYFEHMKLCENLNPRKLFLQYVIKNCFLPSISHMATFAYMYYSAPEFPENMVAFYHCLVSLMVKETCHMKGNVKIRPTCAQGGVA